MRQPHDHINWQISGDNTVNMHTDLTTDSEIIMNMFENDHNSSSTSNSTQKDKSGNSNNKNKSITNNRDNTFEKNKKDLDNNGIDQTSTPYVTDQNCFFPSSLTNTIMNSTPLNFMKQYPLPNQYIMQGQSNQLLQPQPQHALQPIMNFNFDSPQFDTFFTFTPNKTQKTHLPNQKPQSRPHSRTQQQNTYHRQSLNSQKSQFIPSDPTFGLITNLSTPLANKSSISIFDTPYFNNLFMNSANNANSTNINIDPNQAMGSSSQFSRVLLNVDTPFLDSIEKALMNSTPLPKVNNKKIKNLNNSNPSIVDDLKETSFNRDNSCIYKVVESTRSERCQDIIQIPTVDLDKSKRTPKRKSKSNLLVSSTPVRNGDTSSKIKNNTVNSKSNVDDSFDDIDENKNNIIINSSPSTIVVSSASKSISRYTISHSLNVEASPTPINKSNNYSHSMSFNMTSMNSTKTIDFNIDPSLQSTNIPEAPVMGVFKEKKNRDLKKHSTFPPSQNGKITNNESGNIFSIQSVNNKTLKSTTKSLNRSESMPDSIMNKNSRKRKNGAKGGIQFVMTDVTKLKGNKRQRRVVQPKKVIPLSNTTNIINNTNNNNTNNSLKEGKLEIHKRMHTFKTKSEPQFINKEFKEKENV